MMSPELGLKPSLNKQPTNMGIVGAGVKISVLNTEL